MPATSREALQPIVKINGQVRADWICTRVLQTMGSRTPDMAVLEYRHSGLPILQNQHVAVFRNDDLVEVVIPTQPQHRVHWGRVADTRVRMGENDVERIDVISRLDRHLLSGPIDRAHYIDNAGNSRGMFTWPLVFNPIVDNQPFGNRATAGPFIVQNDGPGVPLDSVLADHDSIPLSGAQAATFGKWNIPEAVRHVCQAYGLLDDIGIPQLNEISLVTGSDRNVLRNVHIPFGTYLTEALDVLLEPYGFAWRMDYTQNKPTIRIERRAGTAAVDLLLQPYGQGLDRNRSEVMAMSVGMDRVDLAATRVQCVGAPKRYEATFELMEAWEPALDDTPLEDLAINSSSVQATPALGRVWRDWVLNENDDYSELRANRGDVDVPFLLTGEHYPRRRMKLLPTLSTHPDTSPWGEATGVFVEVSLDAGVTWQPAAEALENPSYEVLDKEAGIRFNAAAHPPIEFFDRNSPESYVQVRVTASFEVGDYVGVAATTNANQRFVTGATIRQYVAAPDYHWRRVLDDKSQLFAQASTELDDTQSLQELADRLMAANRQSSMSGTITMEGVDYPPGRFWGRAVASILGRNIGMHTTPDQTTIPVIQQIEYDFDEQTTSVGLSTFRQRPQWKIDRMID